MNHSSTIASSPKAFTGILQQLTLTLKYLAFAAALFCVTYFSVLTFIGKPSGFPLDLAPTGVAVDLINKGKSTSIYHPQIFPAREEYNAHWLEAATKLGIFRGNVSYVYHPLYAGALSILLREDEIDKIPSLIFWGTIISIVLISWQMVSLSGARSVAPAFAFSVIFAAIGPTEHCINLGQNSIIAAAFALTGVNLMTQREGRFLAGLLCLLVGCTLKPWVIGCLAVFILLKEYRKLLKAIIAHTLVLEILPWLLFPPEVMEGYWSVRTALARISLGACNDFSLHASLLRVYLDQPGPVLYFWGRDLVVPGNFRVLFQICAIAGLILTSLGMFRFHGDRVRAISLSLAIPLLFLGVAWTHYFVFCLPLIFVNIMGSALSPLNTTLSIILLVRLARFNIAPYISEQSVMIYLTLPYILLFLIVVPPLFRRTPPLLKSNSA